MKRLILLILFLSACTLHVYGQHGSFRVPGHYKDVDGSIRTLPTAYEYDAHNRTYIRPDVLDKGAFDYQFPTCEEQHAFITQAYDNAYAEGKDPDMYFFLDIYIDVCQTEVVSFPVLEPVMLEHFTKPYYMYVYAKFIEDFHANNPNKVFTDEHKGLDNQVFCKEVITHEAKEYRVSDISMLVIARNECMNAIAATRRIMLAYDSQTAMEEGFESVRDANQRIDDALAEVFSDTIRAKRLRRVGTIVSGTIATMGAIHVLNKIAEDD